MDHQIIRRIYGKLQDDVSKEIFANRLMYSLTGDKRYIGNIVREIEPMRWLQQEIENSKECFLFGAGQHGKEILRVFPDVWTGILDNDPNKWQEKLGGVTIVPPTAIKDHPEAHVFLAARKHGENYVQEILDQLEHLGVDPQRIVRVDQGVFAWLDHHQYFDLPAFLYEDDETYVDAGACYGETALEFSKWAGNYRHIYMFEPDPFSRSRCEEVQRKLGERKSTILPYGLWSEKGELTFQNTGDGCSHLTPDGKIHVPVTSIDQEFGKERITFIKLDVEGAELQVLHGAEQCIREHHPKLAICVYHKWEDIVEIPSYILSICSRYRFYLRHYSLENGETVLYAV